MSEFGLTHIQSTVLSVIRANIEEDGVAPSFVEIKEATGILSNGNLHRIMVSLEQRGHIHRIRKSARAIALGPAPAPKCCPHCGGAVA